MAADSDSESTMNLQDPELILLFTWTGAKPHHIAKYTAAYTKLFPSSPIMVITTSLKDFLHRSSPKKQLSLVPAILTILSSRLDANFLVHCFSEGGAHKAVQFTKAFLKSAGRPLPVSALCLDSARRTLDHAETAQACQWNTADRRPILQTLTSLLAYTLAPSCWTTYPLTCDAFLEGPKHQYTFDKSRRALNDPRLWNVEAPRCYLFSHDDKLTDPRSVLEHARGAEKLGARVFLAPFEDPAPIKSLSTTAEIYWATVQRTWDACGSASLPDNPYRAEIEKPAYDIYVTEVEKKKKLDTDIQACVHELPSSPSPVEQKQTPETTPVLLASSSVYSPLSERPREASPTTAAPPARSYTGPGTFCIKKEKRKWYDCLRPVPGYQGWGGMGVDTEEFSYERITQRQESCQSTSIFQYFYVGI
jgi:hypothetical protein